MYRLIIKNAASHIKNWWRGIFALVLITVVFMGLLLFYYLNDSTNIGMYADADFDFIFHAISKEQVQEYADNSFIKKAVPFKSISEMQICTADQKCNEVGIVAFDHIKDSIDISFFSPARMLKAGKKADSGEPEIYLDYYIAHVLQVSVGDQVFIPWRESETISYTVAGIYEATTYIDSHTAMIEWDAQVQNLMKDIYGDSDWYSGAFIKTNDVEAFSDYLKNHPYYPGQYYLDLSDGMGERDAEILKEDIISQDWFSLIVKRDETVQVYYAGTIWNKSAKHLIIFGGAVLIVLTTIAGIFRPFLRTAQKDILLFEYLGVEKKHICICFEAVICVSLAVLFLISYGIYHVFIENILFSNYLVSGNMALYEILFAAAAYFVDCFVFSILLAVVVIRKNV